MLNDRQLIRFRDLINKFEYVINRIPYEWLLQTIEWSAKRGEILLRDEFYCTLCGAGSELIAEDSSNSPIFGHYFKKDRFLKESEDGIKYYCDIVSETVNYPIYLHVHHKYYKEGLLPWDYPDDCLTTLCSKCHYELHQKHRIPYYDKNGKEKIYTPCKRCNGAGIFPEFKKIENGICFRCHGAKYEELINV